MPRTAYQKYLASREWATRREAVRERSKGICERCLLFPMTATHHLTYANVGNEPLEDLLAICGGCHEYVSAKSSLDPRGLVWAETIADLIASVMYIGADVEEAQLTGLTEYGGRLREYMNAEPPALILWPLVQAMTVVSD